MASLSKKYVDERSEGGERGREGEMREGRAAWGRVKAKALKALALGKHGRARTRGKAARARVASRRRDR